jgi:hypothetical protein
VLGVVGIALAWSLLDLTRLPTSEHAERRTGRVLLPVAAVLVFARYPAGLSDWMSSSPDAKDYLAGPTFGWTIALLDLGLALPATVAVCIGYRRGAGWARRGLYGVVGWLALVGTAVAGMAVAMQAREDPAMSAPQMSVMVVLGMLLVAIAAGLFGPVLRGARRTTAASPAATTR